MSKSGSFFSQIKAILKQVEKGEERTAGLKQFHFFCMVDPRQSFVKKI